VFLARSADPGLWLINRDSLLPSTLIPRLPILPLLVCTTSNLETRPLLSNDQPWAKTLVSPMKSLDPLVIYLDVSRFSCCFRDR
jgi:hypothetical protein